MTRRRVLPLGAHQKIADLLLQGWPPKHIYGELERTYGVQAPGYRTVQRIVAELTPKDASGPWTMSEDPDGDEAALVLPIIAAAIEMSAGKLRGVTVAQARWIVRLRRVVPELGERIVFYLAYRFVLAETTDRAGRLIEETEQWLAFAPWRSDAARARYFRAVREGWIGNRTAHELVERVWIESDGQTTLTYRAGRAEEVPDGDGAEGKPGRVIGGKPTRSARGRAKRKGGHA